MTARGVLAWTAISILLSLPVAATAADKILPEVAASPTAPGLVAFHVDGKDLPLLPKASAFEVFDATAKRRIAFADGDVTETADGVAYDCLADGIRLQAEFVNRKGYVLVTGTLENTHQDDRGLILDYWLPSVSGEAVFCNELDQRTPVSGDEPQEGNAFPIAAMCNESAGLAMALPPSEPRIFGMVGSTRGLAVRFYLGLSPVTKNFPNSASFAFLIYSVDSSSGFRGALDRYYDLFPDYYTPRLERGGLFMFQMEDRVPANIDQYAFSLVESQSPVLEAAIRRDEQYGIATFPYMIVGQREIKFLDTLPADYNEAMAAYEAWTLDDHAGHALTKENVASQGDIHLKEEVESSACKRSDGSYAVVIRNTPWGENSVTFKINPNPDLFDDTNRPTVASYAFELMEKWLERYPQYDGMFVDSLGRNWPAVLNYRKDHFKYARYPLTLDADGDIALHNQISHYEYVETLRDWMRSVDRLVLANGVYAYRTKKAPVKAVERQERDDELNEFVAASTPREHFRDGAKLGRFFCAALLDVASSEAGVRATIERCQDVRTLMGPKHYTFLNYHWEEADEVKKFVNLSLCFGIFASTSTNFFTGVQYEDHENGYLRDKELLDWYVPLARTLSGAGWEPVRHATLDGEGVCCERFGDGEVVYYTLYNDSAAPVTCTMEIDLAALGFGDGNAVVEEIARDVPLTKRSSSVVAVSLEPERTSIVRVSRGKPN